jgi:serine/threonine protein kinase
VLDGNRLDGSAAVPPALCAFACASDAAFACPFTAAAASCGCPAALAPALPRCAAVDACAPAPGRAPNVTAVAAACVTTLSGCYDCQSALYESLLSTGTPLPDTPTIAACLPAATPAFLAAGASAEALQAQRECAFSARLASNFSCPVVVPSALFAPAVAPCTSILTVCADCSAMFVEILRAAGLQVPPLGLQFTTTDYDTVASCLAKHALPILAAGVSQTTFLWGFAICNGPTPSWFASLLAAPPPPPFPPFPPSPRPPPSAGGGGGGGGGGDGGPSGAAVAGGAAAGAVGGLVLLATVVAAVVTLRRRAAAGAYTGTHANNNKMSGGSNASDLPLLSTSASSGGGGGAMPLLRREEIQLGPLIGSGGFASVYTARWCGTQVAVKLFEPELPWAGRSDSVALAVATSSQPSSSLSSSSLRLDEAGLLREMRVLANLRHPNVCAVYGLVTSPPMLVIELAPAGSLLDVLTRSSATSLPWRDRVAVGAGVAAGVEYLHSQSPPIIHADLKSANVVLSDSLMPKLCDFGLSRVLPTLGVGHAGGDVGAHLHVGTPQYMAPEVVLSAPITLPKAIDAYGLGVVLHDLMRLGIVAGDKNKKNAKDKGGRGGRGGGVSGVTGDASGTGGAVHVFYARAAAAFRVELPAHAPKPLAALTSRCLAVQPEARPSSGEVRAELLALADVADGWGWPAPEAEP